MLKQPGFLVKTSRRRGRLAAAIVAVAAMALAGSARGQSFTEFALPPPSAPAGGLGGIVAGPDGNIWFAETVFGPNVGRIGRITSAGVITEFALPAVDSFPGDMAAGPDGALWFTESGSAGSKIGRITTAGVITEFALPNAGSSLFGIAAGPDGNLWFTYLVSPLPTEGGPLVGRIGRITTAGVVTEFHIPVAGAPVGITAGPDGNLWFTQQDTIGRITTAGMITLFGVPSCGNNTLGIAAGPDGNLWFTDTIFAFGGPSVGKIGRITTAGVITEFTVPYAGSNPRGIAAGPDGNLWFTDGISNAAVPSFGGIGRITTAGAMTELTPPTPSSLPTAITAGPNGDLWFTEQFADKIVQITALGQACTPSATNLCLNNARFKVEASWTAGDGGSGPGQAVALTPDSGSFWFFSPNNVEMVVKALDGCSFNNHDWVFAAGLTNVNVVLTVTDTRTGRVKTYTNPLGTAFQPIQDTSAFSCAPPLPTMLN